MLKSKVIHLSSPLPSLHDGSLSNSSRYNKSSKQCCRTRTPSLDSIDNDKYEQQNDKNNEQVKLHFKQTLNMPSILTRLAIPQRTVSLYMPPAKLYLLQGLLTDKLTVEYQRLSWDALKKSINGQINKVNTLNLSIIIHQLFKHNIVRGRRILARIIIQAQIASPFYTPVYATLISVISTKFPQIGELILKRLISSFRQTYQRNDKCKCLATTKFIPHFINQNVLHEIVALQMLVLLLENPTNDSVELAILFLKECGQKLLQVSSRGLDSIFSTLRNLLHESSLNKRIQYMIEVLFAVRKDQFKTNPTIQSGLYLINENNQYIHILTLDDPYVFKYDEQYEENEAKYKEIRKIILDEISDDENESSFYSTDSDEVDDLGKKEQQQTIIDRTETNLLTLHRTIYLTIQSSIDVDECAHELLKINIRPGQEIELCQMILDSCAQQRAYERFFGLLGQHQYEIVHRLENVKLRNVGKFFAHLLVTNAISWN
ncbi:unnamed protein product, partial [Rotaria sp. Silwood2]